MPQRSRSSRALRGTIAAFFATFVSLISHVLAGGAVPGLLNIALPLSLSTLLCILLSGKRFSLWRLALMIGFSQVLFHLLFSMGSHGAVSSSYSSMHHHHQGMSIDVEALASGAAASSGHGDFTMLSAHVFAGIATVLVLHRSEQVLMTLSDFISLLTWKLLIRLVSFVDQPVHPTVAPTEPREIPAYTVAIYTTSLIRRGPPIHTSV